MRIDRVEVRVVAPEVQRFTWSHDLPQQYMTNTLVRIGTDQGLEGIGGVSNYTSHGFDRYTGEALRHMVPELIGADPLQREQIWQGLWPRVFPLPPQALAAIDIALWDLYGKREGKPIWQLLGGARPRIPAYASTPLLEDVPAYLRLIEELLEMGFRAVKFHCWCLPDKDLELARAARREFPADQVQFMLDAENNYDLEGATRVAAELAALEFRWFEAPLMDYDLPGYRALTALEQVPIIPSGNWIQDLPAFEHALASNCWTDARTDVTVCGGFTPAQKYLQQVAAAGKRCEVMSWGNTLISTANLHLMLGTGLCSYYEQPIPYEPYEYGMRDVIRTAADGCVTGPTGPGLGVEVDEAAMDAATLFRFESHAVKP